MNFLNLGLGELLGLVGAISAGVVALYLLDRSKRRQIVATLRFWSAADVRTELKHRRRIQQPWSLLLQLISLALLLTAIAGPQLGIFDATGSDHVILLDTSAWMGSRANTAAGQGVLMDQARASARAYLRSIPRRDRVMLVRADALATPATAFESNRGALESAIQQSQAGASALNLAQALEFAERAQKLQSQRSGEIVFIGAGRVSEEEAALSALPANLRVVSTNSTLENVGLRKIGLRRSPSAPDAWDVFVVVKNYGVRPQSVDLGLQFSQSPAGSRRITLRPGAEEQATFSYTAKSGGFLEARLNVRDAFPQDDRAVVELPPQASSRVVVYSDEPQFLRPLFLANAQVDAVFEAPAKFDPAVKADIVVLDRFVPNTAPRAASIYIQPPANGSPVPVRSTRTGLRLDTWHAETTLGAGLRTRDVTLESAEVFSPAAADTVVAETTEGPVVVAREGTRAGEPKQVMIGFHPGRGSMKYELATPLLIANILRWMVPGAFRRWEFQAGTVGTVNVPVEKTSKPEDIKVLDEANRGLPFTVEDNNLRFFSGAPGTVRVQMGDREMVYSLTLPDVGEAVWRVPASVHKGVPRAVLGDAAPRDLWPWLAILGGLGLLADWLLYGRSRAFRLRSAGAMVSPWKPGWKKVTQWRKAS
ncbi:MAG TPA: VWA domain-containing protein [Bryobacteraceae bacterium]|nr:VWA domain-containing protein [Bryobacteraceae bacterium]